MKITKLTLRKVMACLMVGSLLATGIILPAQNAEVYAKSNAGAVALARQAAAEGIVVLENNDNVLPLKANSPVAIFGRCQYDTFSGGYGTGKGPNTDYPPITIMQGFDNNPALSYNEELAETYRDWISENPIQTGGWGTWPANHPEMPVSNELAAKAATVSDTAIVVIGRAAGEDRELTYDEIKLTAEETEMLENVNNNFENIIVLMNVGNVIDMAWRSDYENIKSVVYVWQGGLENGNAIADVLSGDVSPSGKLADTIATSFDYYPSSIAGFGLLDGDAWNEVYREDIYVGYRYFETFHPEQVLYPFGFGLSYTEFDIDSSVSFEDGNVVVEATVTNIGDTYSGKEVVQVYYGAPQGALGKPTRELAAYAKTNEIAPGASQTLTISFPISNMASYDDCGATGYESAWVLEAGEYKIYVGNSVRDAKHVKSYSVKDTIVTEQLAEANSIILDQLRDIIAINRINAPYGGLTRLVPVDNGDGTYTANWKGEMPYYETFEESGYSERVLASIQEAGENEVALTGDKGIKLIDVYNGEATLDEFISQLTVKELAVLTRGYGPQSCDLCDASGNGGGFGGLEQSLRDKGVPAVSTRGTPAGVGISGTHKKIPIATQLACTFNDPLVQQLYYYVGQEGVDYYLDVHLAPSMNVHRNPLGGRNFEYYSEDPVLAGQMAASATNGAQAAGISACPKHFALNSQEEKRRYTDSVVSERAQREVYLKAFEICVKSSDPDTIMASYNRINGFDTCYNFDLATTILREQWGWDGVLMTDWWLNRDSSDELGVAFDAWRIRAQVDLNMPGIMPGYVGRESEMKNDWANYNDYVGDDLVIAFYENWVANGSPYDRIIPLDPNNTITVDKNQPQTIKLGGLTLGEIQRSAKTVLKYVMTSRTFRIHNNLPLDLQTAPEYTYFDVEGRLEETKPLLSSLTISGLSDFDSFHPLTNTYQIFTRNFDSLPKVSAKAEGNATVTIKQATKDDPTALITVNNDSGKNIYRVIFTNKAGLTPIAKNPVYAYPTDILIDGVSLPAYYQTVYSYDIVGDVNETEITVDTPNGVDATVTKNEERNRVVIRTESDHQALEYTINFVTGEQKIPVSDEFNDSTLNTDVWQVLNSVHPEYVTTSGGTLNIKTDIGEWHQNANSLRNVVYQTMEGDFEATVDITIPAGLNGGGANQFGMLVFDDANNYADIRYQTTAKGRYDNLKNHYVAFVHETNGVATIALRDPVIMNEGWNTDAYTGELKVTFRISKSGDIYTFGYKTAKMALEGKDFVTVGTYEGKFAQPKIGLFATRVDSASPQSIVKFDNFNVPVETGEPKSDSFDSGLNSFWQINNSTDKLKVENGAVVITPEQGEWFEDNENYYADIKNLVYQTAEGDWTVSLDVTIPGGLAYTSSQIGMHVFDDSDNFMNIMYQSASSLTSFNGHVFASRAEVGGALITDFGRVDVPNAEGWGAADTDVTFRITKTGNVYSTYYQTAAMKAKGEGFALARSTTLELENPKIGLYATTGSDNKAVDYSVKFTNFTAKVIYNTPQSDNFNGNSIGSFWTVDNEDTSKYNVSNGALNITTAKGDLYGGYNEQTPVVNWFNQTAKGEKWTATLTYTIQNPSLIASKSTSGLMLVVFEDRLNYLDVGVMTNSSAAVNPMYVNSRRKPDMYTNPTQTRPLNDSNPLKKEGWFTSTEPQTISVRIVKDGNLYKTYYQTETMKENGTDFALLRSDNITNFTNPKIGFYMVAGSTKEFNSGSATPSNVSIDSFVISDYVGTDDGTTGTPETPEAPELSTVTVSDKDTTTVGAVDDLWYATENLKSATSENGTKYLTHSQAGEYALYQINVAKTGYYDIAPVIAAVNESSGGLMLELYVEVDGNRVAEYRATATDTWTSFTEQSPVTVKLTEGVHKLRFVFDGVANFSGINITPAKTIIGDVDQNGEVDDNDIITLRSMIIGKIEKTDLGDVNSDGNVDICDLVKVNNIVNKIS
ncbi:MAG: glycoside hydrolase family 3 C-terminal domain-containing protein [Clostridia bacterium]|nr:glycoside hydrolase family 3 C-terminal domain-containing protein [Clostridia bacterium]